MISYTDIWLGILSILIIIITIILIFKILTQNKSQKENENENENRKENNNKNENESQDELHVLKLGTVDMGGGFSHFDQMILDDYNESATLLNQFDICAVQKILVPNARWNNPKQGSVELFRSMINKRWGSFILASAVAKTTEYQEAYGLFINANLNFVQENITVISDSPQITEFRGAVIVTGKLFNIYNVAIVGMYGAFYKSYDNPESQIVFTKIFDYINTNSIEHIIFAGNTNIRYPAFKALLEKVNPKGYSDVDFSEESLVTVYDGYGFAHPDHLFSTFKIKNVRTQFLFPSKHYHLCCDVLIPNVKFPLKGLIVD